MKRLLLVLLVSAAAASEPALTLEQALQRGLSGHPQLRAARARVQQAQIGRDYAGSLPPAQVGVGSWHGSGDALTNANYLGRDRSDVYFTLSQEFRPPGQAAAREQLSGQELESARAELRSERLELARQLKDAYFAQVAAGERLRLAKESLSLAEQLLHLTTTMCDHGRSPKLDQWNASIQKTRAQQEVLAASGEEREARVRLAALVGLDSPEPTEPMAAETLPEELVSPAPEHPGLQSARAALEGARAQTRLAESAGGPTPGLLAVYDAVRPSYSVQVTLTVPIDWGTLGGEVAQRREREKEAEALLQARAQRLESDRKAAREAYRRAREQAQLYQREALGPAEELVRVTRYGYERGALPYLQLLTVQQQLSAMRRESVQILLEAYRARHALEAALGLEPPDAPEPETAP